MIVPLLRRWVPILIWLLPTLILGLSFYYLVPPASRRASALRPAGSIGLLVRALGYRPPHATNPSPFFELKAAETGFTAVVDVGAYDCVDYTIPGARAGYRVYAFELNPENAEKCEANLKLAGLRYEVLRPPCGLAPARALRPDSRVVLVVAGGSDSLGCVSVQGSLEMSHFSKSTSVSQGVAPTVRVDDVVPQDERVYVMKVNTQGHETAVLRGALSTLRRTKPEIVALEYWPAGQRARGADPMRTLEIMNREGYACFDTGVHGYNTLNRPYAFGDFNAFLENAGTEKDILGSWDHLVCARVALRS